MKVPLPQYVIFYNGQETWMEGQDVFELSLRDAFSQPEGRNVEPCLECRATVYNINYGHNKELMNQCRKLEEYSIFVDKVVQYKKHKMSNEEAVERAVEDCINNGILRNYLIKHRAEVIGMFVETLNRRKIEKMMIRDARKQAAEKGREEGLAEGREEGLAEGRTKGREYGETYKLVSLICSKLQKGKNVETIAEELEEEQTRVSRICGIAERYAPDYDADLITKKFLQ